MTLGCPAWDLETISSRASAYGYDAIDFRGLLNEIDITRLPAFTTGVAATRRQMQNANLETSGISSSITVCDPDRLTANLEEAKRTIPVALALGSANVRIFGGGPVDKIGREEAARVGRVCVAKILELPAADQISWNFETHDHWIKTVDCKLLLNEITHRAFNALWDIGHTSRVGGETPEQTIAAIGDRIRYVHVKDAAFDKSHPQAMPDGWRYVLPGTGQLPLAQGINLLAKKGYGGYLLFEHEKRWHADLPDPEIAFPAFIKWMEGISDASV